MLTGRKILFEGWERSLDVASKILELVKKRNLLMNETKKKEIRITARKIEYDKCVNALKMFDFEYPKEEIHLDIQKLISKMEAKLKEFEEQLGSNNYRELVKLDNEIEECKTILFRYYKFFKKLKLKKEEISKNRLFEIVVLLLFANDNDDTITEDNFFNEKSDFHELLSKSDNSLLRELSKEKDITYRNFFDYFLFEL